MEQNQGDPFQDLLQHNFTRILPISDEDFKFLQAKPQPSHSPAADIKLVRDLFGQINVGEMFVIAAKLLATNGEGNIMDRLSILAEHVDFCYAISSFHAP